MDLSKILVLVLDRDPVSREKLARILTEQGYAVVTSDTEAEACRLAEKHRFNLVIKGFEAAKIDAVALMKKIRALTHDTQFILVGKGGSIKTAVSALHQGAFDYLDKPCDPTLLLEAVGKALDHQAIVAEDHELKARLRRRGDPDIFVGDSPAAQRIRALVAEVAPADITVLLTGESGTGKEIVARAIHTRSRRREGPFIAVNSAALPSSKANSLARCAEPSPAPFPTGSAASRWPTAARSSSMKSATSPRKGRPTSCACWKMECSVPSAARSRCAPMCASSLRPIANSNKPPPKAVSATTFSTA
jgi:DNA-binding NtrC family response regulator